MSGIRLLSFAVVSAILAFAAHYLVAMARVLEVVVR